MSSAAAQPADCSPQLPTQGPLGSQASDFVGRPGAWVSCVWLLPFPGDLPRKWPCTMGKGGGTPSLMEHGAPVENNSGPGFWCPPVTSGGSNLLNVKNPQIFNLPPKHINSCLIVHVYDTWIIDSKENFRSWGSYLQLRGISEGQA